MSGAMLHGLGDCTPELNCGCVVTSDPTPLGRGRHKRQRCWIHRWETIGLIGLAVLTTHDRCRKCGKERIVQVTP